MTQEYNIFTNSIEKDNGELSSEESEDSSKYYIEMSIILSWVISESSKEKIRQKLIKGNMRRLRKYFLRKVPKMIVKLFPISVIVSMLT